MPKTRFLTSLSVLLLSLSCIGCVEDTGPEPVTTTESATVSETVFEIVDNKSDSDSDNDYHYKPYNEEKYRENIDYYGVDSELAQKFDEWDRKKDERDAYYDN